MEANYRIWRQYDDDWNGEEAWPEAEFPDAGSRYLRKSGCFITSVAIMLRRYHIEKEENPELFNPLILCEKLKNSGAYDRAADILPESLSRIYPIEYLGTVPFTYQKAVDCLKNEQPCLIMVPGRSGPYHYIVPDALEGTDIRICDPGWAMEYLSEFEIKCNIVLFRDRGFCSENTVKYFSGTIENREEQLRLLEIPENTRYPERDILARAFDRWGTELSCHIAGDYAAVLRNAVQKKQYLIKSLTGTAELYYYACESGRYLYGSQEYITSSAEYCAGQQIASLGPGECISYSI